MERKRFNLHAVYASVVAGIANLSKRGKREHERHVQQDASRTEVPRWRGSSGVNMSPHVRKMMVKRNVRRKVARKSRRVNRRVAQA